MTKKIKDEMVEGEDYYSDMFDTLGTEDPDFGLKQVKEMIKGILDGGYIQNFNDMELWQLFSTAGILNRSSKYATVFDKLPKMPRTGKEIKELEKWANNPDDTSVPLSGINTASDEDAEAGQEIISEGGSGETGELENNDPLDYDDSEHGKYNLEKRLGNIFLNGEKLESFVSDPEKIKFFQNSTIKKYWKEAFKINDATKIVEFIKKKGMTGNSFTDSVSKKFLEEYDGVMKILRLIPNDYSFIDFNTKKIGMPRLMQLYFTNKIRTSPYYCNLSGTGSGKTLSAVLASRIMDCKVTLVICPNDVVEQWGGNSTKNKNGDIKDIFPNSVVYTKDDVFTAQLDSEKHQYLILNWEKFQIDSVVNKLRELEKEKIDLIVLDEIQFVKIRGNVSGRRREHLEAFINGINATNPKVKVVGLSATPVINELSEGRSLLNLVTGWNHDKTLKVNPNVGNAVALHEKFANISVREKPEYGIYEERHFVDVDAEWPSGKESRQLIANPLMAEEILTKIRIPKILELIDGPTIIYTEYVGSSPDSRSDRIIDMLEKAVKKAGHSVAIYTGEDHSGKDLFINGQRDVLIASRPIAVGVNGLQWRTNRLIINTLPWTNANYQQLIGRLIRYGQKKDKVDVFIVRASLDGWRYDEQFKWGRILIKKTIAECAVDGIIPRKHLVSAETATKAAVNWLKRLENGEFSVVTKRRLDTRLAPVEVKKRLKKYGKDLRELNQKINVSKSDTIYKQMNAKNGEMWEEYHRRLRDVRKTWRVDPLKKIIERIEKMNDETYRWAPIGDFGCGEAMLADKFGNRVQSFDAVSHDSRVTSCNIAKVPVKDGDLGIIVFCQSLMGIATAWPEYIKEASRCLAKGGILLIAESTKAIKENDRNLGSINEVIKENEFELNPKECYDEYKFTFIEARKL
tara:strand:+ start:386 stop:3127 length:2742 start_codon:yes stop_codon:yes gene_type:complete